MGAPESETENNADSVSVLKWRVTQLERMLGTKLDEILREIRDSKVHQEEKVESLRQEFGQRLTSLETDRAKAVGAGWVAKLLIGLCTSGLVGVAFSLWQILQRLPKSPMH